MTPDDIAWWDLLDEQERRNIATARELVYPEDICKEIQTIVMPKLTAELRKRGWLTKRAPGGTVNTIEQETLARIYEVWKKTCNYPDAGSKITKSRAAHALARLREGATIAQFTTIMEWAAADPFMSGRDPKTNGRRYTDFPNLFGSAQKFEKYLQIANDWKNRGDRRRGLGNGPGTDRRL